MQRQPIIASEPRTVPGQVSVYTAPANPTKDLSLKLRLPTAGWREAIKLPDRLKRWNQRRHERKPPILKHGVHRLHETK